MCVPIENFVENWPPIHLRIRIMSNAIQLPAFCCLLLLFGVSGGCSDSKPGGEQSNKAPSLESAAYFESAEQKLVEKRYLLAAQHLDKGIVAFRIETGKMSGARAARANRAIDRLTRLRKTLRHNESVNADELHQAILSAMEAEPGLPSPIQHPKPGSGLGVPVGGH